MGERLSCFWSNMTANPQKGSLQFFAISSFFFLFPLFPSISFVTKEIYTAAGSAGILRFPARGSSYFN